MSSLGNEIRDQERAANRLADDLSQASGDLSTRTDATQWFSTAADQCRTVLDGFSAHLSNLSRDARDFADDIDQHADVVESHEASLLAPFKAVGDALHRDESEGPFDYSYPGDWRG